MVALGRMESGAAWDQLAALVVDPNPMLSLLATLYPSWRASRVNPAEALRYE